MNRFHFFVRTDFMMPRTLSPAASMTCVPVSGGYHFVIGGLLIGAAHDVADCTPDLIADATGLTRLGLPGDPRFRSGYESNMPPITFLHLLFLACYETMNDNI